MHGGWSGVEWSCSGVLPRRVEAAVRREVQHRTLTHPVQCIPAHTTHTARSDHTSDTFFRGVDRKKSAVREGQIAGAGPALSSQRLRKPPRAAPHNCICLCWIAPEFRQLSPCLKFCRLREGVGGHVQVMGAGRQELRLEVPTRQVPAIHTDAGTPQALAVGPRRPRDACWHQNTTTAHGR